MARWPRWRWLRLLAAGLALWSGLVLFMAVTGDTRLAPTVVLLGGFLVPAAAAVYDFDHRVSLGLSGQRRFFALLYGGVLGLLAAVLFQGQPPRGGLLLPLGVGLAEETAKLAALLLVATGLYRRSLRDGLVLGAAVGLGFGALEGSSATIAALVAAGGRPPGPPAAAELLRGALAPLVNGLWTAVLGGVAFQASRVGPLVLSGGAVAALLGVSALHALWEAMRGIAATVALLLLGSPLPAGFPRSGVPLEPAGAAVPSFVVLYVGGLLLCTLVGLLLLQGLWHRAAWERIAERQRGRPFPHPAPPRGRP